MFARSLLFKRQGIFFDGGHGQGASGLDDAAGVDEDVLDGGADLIGVNRDEVVNQVLGDAEGLLSHQFHRRAIRK